MSFIELSVKSLCWNIINSFKDWDDYITLL